MANQRVLRWAPYIKAAAQKWGIPPRVLAAVIEHESGGQEGLTSSAGAKGLTQFMPGTAASYHVNTSPGHGRSQIFGAAHYLHDLGFASDPRRALASYAAGPANIPAGLPYARDVLAIAPGYRNLAGGVASPSPASSPASTSPASTTRTIPGVDNSAARLAAITQYASQSGRPGSAVDLYLGLQNAQDTPARAVNTTPRAQPAGPAAGSAVSGARHGDPVVGGTSIGGVHDTAGLSGYPARDYFAKAGSTVVAPVSGVVHKLSGHDPRLGPPQGPGGPLGWSVYIKGTDGRDYFLTHMGSRNVRVGQHVRAGQRIGTVANYHSYGRPDHIHMGVHG